MKQEQFLEVVKALDANEGDCYGTHVEGHSGCGSCFMESKCSMETARLNTLDLEQKAEELTNPIDYLVDHLRKTRGYDVTFEEGEKSDVHYFRVKDVAVLMMAISKAGGKIKLQSRQGQRILDSFKSKKQIDKILSELLPQ